MPRVSVPALLACVCACSGSRASGFDDPGDAGAEGGAPETPGTPGTLGGDGGGDASGGGGGGTTLLYAHTDTTLYSLDPAHVDQPLVRIGDFDCVGTSKPAKTMTDLAVGKDGKLYGVSEGAAFPLTIQGSTVHCDATWPLPKTKFYGLTVAPENVLGPTEQLVAADGAGGLYRIDATSGTPTQVGTLGTDPSTGLPWALSGDIVFLANGGQPIGFATVRTCPPGGSCSKTDTLIEVDVGAIHPGTQSVMKSVRGQVVRGASCTNASSPPTFGSMFGIVAYESHVFGFSRAGDVVEIDTKDGSGCLVSSDASKKFAGAGVTTIAPVVAPPS